METNTPIDLIVLLLWSFVSEGLFADLNIYILNTITVINKLNISRQNISKTNFTIFLTILLQDVAIAKDLIIPVSIRFLLIIPFAGCAYKLHFPNFSKFPYQTSRPSLNSIHLTKFLSPVSLELSDTRYNNHLKRTPHSQTDPFHFAIYLGTNSNAQCPE